MKFRRPRKLRPFERLSEAFVLVLLVLVMTFVGYELNLGLAGLAGGLVVVIQGAAERRKSKRRLERQS
jgi:hypothetical protein